MSPHARYLFPILCRIRCVKIHFGRSGLSVLPNSLVQAFGVQIDCSCVIITHHTSIAHCLVLAHQEEGVVADPLGNLRLNVPDRAARGHDLDHPAVSAESRRDPSPVGDTIDVASLPIPRDPSTFSEGDWRHSYVGFEGLSTF